jgi:hypothetical protein
MKSQLQPWHLLLLILAGWINHTRALAPGERAKVLEHLHQERFVDRAQAEVFASLLDEGTYPCSIRTMYRILAAADAGAQRSATSSARP